MPRKYTGFFWHLIEEWSQFFRGGNYNFHPFVLELKWERNRGGVEMTAVLLGIGGAFRYNYAETELVRNEQDIIKHAMTYMAQQERETSSASVH